MSALHVLTGARISIIVRPFTVQLTLTFAVAPSCHVFRVDHHLTILVCRSCALQESEELIGAFKADSGAG